jgi:hypothetical protein
MTIEAMSGLGDSVTLRAKRRNALDDVPVRHLENDSRAVSDEEEAALPLQETGKPTVLG